MKKIALEDLSQLESIQTNPSYAIIFKHSTRCPISSMALNRINNHPGLAETEVPFYLLDLLNFRALSNEISQRFSVPHESPQLLLIKQGTCVLDASHIEISPDEVLTMLQEKN
jgi:bacillithiol system protein YtxJ